MSAWTAEDLARLRELLAEGLQSREIAARMGRTTPAINNKIGSEGLLRSKVCPGEEQFHCEHNGTEQATVVSVSRTIKTAEDACAYGKIDLELWEIVKQRVSSSETAMKMDDGSVKVVPLWHIRVEAKRKAPKRITDALESFFERIRKHSPSVPKPPRKARPKEFLFEWSAFDAHFGKRCWGEETGTNYDTPIAEAMFSNAVDDLIAKVQHKPIGEVIFPLGQDFFNVDNWVDTTHAGTPQDTDDRFQKVFLSGLMSIVSATEKLLSLAPVKILWVPGNHDMTTSWYLANCIQQRFHSSKHVEVDVSPATRKYIQWGTTMLMLLHGDEEKEKDFGSIAATERPDLWSCTTWREAHCGHYHKKKEMQAVDIDEHNGFRVRRLPSLSGTDRWHYRKGYVGGKRCVEGYLFSREYGFDSLHNAIGRE